MPITASYGSVTRKLNVLGDAAANSIIISRDAAQTIFINGGAVSITGGPATVPNTDLIEVFGLDLNDVITLDQTNGSLPAADLFGGNGNDTLTGGSNADTLNGDAGIDILLGQGGTDELFGGADGDFLTGGDANDVMNGEDGNDRMTWNPGDDNDVMEGGPGSDVAEVNGGNGAETFAIAPDVTGTRVAFSRVTPAIFTIDIGTTESLVLNANGGDDVITATGNLAALISFTIDGGAGNDTIIGSNGADTIAGGDNNDFIDGNQGADVAFLGAGNDVFNWDPGDGSDTVEGQGDADELLFNGSNASENINILPNGGRASFLRDIAAISMDLNDLETITYNALSGADNVTIADVTGTDLTRINLNLAASGGSGDGQVDSVSVAGTSLDDVITATLVSGSVDVSGLAALVHITTPEATDRLVLSANVGDDVVDASGLPAGAMAVELQGGLGDDVFIGSAGNDLILGGDGNDIALMGAGDDTFVWKPGDDLDTLEGQAGIDTMVFNGNGAVETITIDPNGGRVRFFRDVAAVTMDLNDVERIVFDAGAGTDTIVINDLTGTDAQLITLNLAGTIGGTVGDGAVDTITANGSGVIDTIAVSGSGGSITATGLPYSLAINQAESGDQLTIAAAAGADVVDASGLTAGNISLTLSGGTGNDEMTGSSGADLMQGGDNNDILVGGPGGDSLLGENGNDTLVWNNGDGSDVMEGGIGSDTAQVNGSASAETFTIAANGARVAFNRVDPAPFVLDIGTTENLVLFAGDGDDVVTTSGNIAALIALTVDGGVGNDTILAGNGSDQLQGGDGNDFIDGNQGNDTAFLGAGADIFQWDPGDGNDTVEGQADIDALIFNGNGANEVFNVSPNGGRAQLIRDVGLVNLDVNDLEQVTVNAGSGSDSIFVNDVTGTEITNITVNLAGTIGGSSGDGLFDFIQGVATGADNLINLVGAGSSYFVTGLPALLSVNQSEATDALTVQAGGGNDIILGGGMGTGVVALTLDGGIGNDTIEGTAGGDTLLGGDGNDIVDGNFGGDTAFLGIGDDVFEWDPGDGSDVVEGQAGSDTLLFNGSNTAEIITVGPNGGRALFTRSIGTILMDMDDIETITFNAFGGADDIKVANMAGTDVTRVVLELAGSGGGGDGQADIVTIDATAIGDNVDVSTTAPGIVTVTGLSCTVEIRNFESVDQLVINGLAGAELFDSTDLDAGIALVVNGGDGLDNLVGGDADEVFDGGADGDFLNGGGGLDTLLGGAGIDFVRVVGLDALVDGGSDQDLLDLDLSGIASAVTLDLSNPAVDQNVLGMIVRNFEHLEYDGGSGVDRVTGGALANELRGGAGNDVLAGGSSNDVLDGGVGSDTMRGGAGDDTYFVDSSGDRAEETSPADGTDTVFSSVNVVLGANVDNLFLTGTAGISGTGNALANTLSGNSGANRLDGAGGADTMFGNGGGDVYIVNNIGDQAIELSATGGLDIVQSSVSFTLGDFVERLFLTGIAVAGTGNALPNQLFGNAGANLLDGGAAADLMTGGAGNDTFIADASGDRAIELGAGDGTDKVEASANYQLGAFIENLTLTGVAAINGTGNNLANFIIGNDSANILNGSGADDTMKGGGGNDRYVVDNVDDRAIETDAAGGLDSVESRVSFTLGAFVENLTLTGIAVSATGNSLDNFIVGNDTSNTIDGGTGVDTMRGNGGNDIYVVDNSLDRAIEADAGGGIDLVKSSASFTLGNFVENLTLTGIGAVNGTGNGLANTITGNGAANTLDGAGGVDTMRGGAGNDSYFVNDALDRAIENAGEGTDIVNSTVSFTLGNFVENLTLIGGFSVNATGNGLANTLTGNGGVNQLNGLAGSDALIGGGGADKFLFTTALGATNVDVIDDMQLGIDKIVLENAVFTALGAGALGANAFNTGTAATDADDRIIYDPVSGALIYDRDGTGAIAAVQFATLDVGLALAATDFQVI